MLEGDGRVDESMLTGESAAVAKPPGARVHQGTHNLGAPLRVRVTAVAGNTVLSGIVALLERAQAERPRLAKAADRAAAWFLGRILVGAAIVFAVWWYVDPSRAFSATLAVLVVTCPCALSLATPTALAAATAALARRGVLVAHTDAHRDAVEGDARAVGQDRHADQGPGARRGRAHARRELTAEQALALGRRARAAVGAPDRPRLRRLGRAGRPRASDVEVHAGRGLEGTVDGRRLRIGTRAFARGAARAAQARRPPPAPSPDDGTGESWVYLGDDTGLLAAFRLTDPLRPEAARLRRGPRGARAALGDRERRRGRARWRASRRAAASSATRHASRPQDKLARLKALQADGAVVVAVGDGINDAPLLRGADVAIAMGRGSALAQTSADLILVRDSLDDLPHTVDARAAHAARDPPEPRLVDRLQPRGAAARRARLRAAVARGDRHVAELGGRGAERDAPVARHRRPQRRPGWPATPQAEAA